MCLARVLLYQGMEVQWDKTCAEELLIDIDGVDSEEWERRYPDLFEETSHYKTNEFFHKLQVFHKDID